MLRSYGNPPKVLIQEDWKKIEPQKLICPLSRLALNFKFEYKKIHVGNTSPFQKKMEI